MTRTPIIKRVLKRIIKVITVFAITASFGQKVDSVAYNIRKAFIDEEKVFEVFLDNDLTRIYPDSRVSDHIARRMVTHNGTYLIHFNGTAKSMALMREGDLLATFSGSLADLGDVTMPDGTVYQHKESNKVHKYLRDSLVAVEFKTKRGAKRSQRIAEVKYKGYLSSSHREVMDIVIRKEAADIAFNVKGRAAFVVFVLLVLRVALASV